jgi:hypothetical protein
LQGVTSGRPGAAPNPGIHILHFASMTDHKQPRVKVSGLWADTTKDCTKYLSGSNGGQRWSIWPNSYKEDGDSAPSHILYIENLPPKEDKKAPSNDAF